MINERLRIVTDGNRCFLPVEEQRLVSSLLPPSPRTSPTTSRPASVRGPRQLPIPKIVDIANGVVTYDDAQWRKRGDWTYSER